MPDRFYTCFCELTVIAKDGEVTLSRSVELPFPPSKGLELVFDYRTGDRFVCDRVEYSTVNGAFYATQTVESEAGCDCRPGDDCCEIGYDLEFYPAHGWEVLDGPRYGADRQNYRPWMFGAESHHLHEFTKEPGCA